MVPSAYVSPYKDERDSIPDETLLYRRVIPRFIDWTVRDDQGRPRLTGGAFQDYSAEAAQRLGLPAPAMSVGLAPILEKLGFPPLKMLEAVDETYGLAAMRAEDVRSLQQGVMAHETEPEPWHAIVFSLTAVKKNKTVQSALAARAWWVHVPPEPRA